MNIIFLKIKGYLIDHFKFFGYYLNIMLFKMQIIKIFFVNINRMPTFALPFQKYTDV